MLFVSRMLVTCWTFYIQVRYLQNSIQTTPHNTIETEFGQIRTTTVFLCSEYNNQLRQSDLLRSWIYCVKRQVGTKPVSHFSAFKT
uniref:Uncharacterized protein n=1 Tax=Anguilla anguilla TaxID=7936 RepID=A0A0E9X695_ANGAN